MSAPFYSWIFQFSERLEKSGDLISYYSLIIKLTYRKNYEKTC